MAFLSMNDRLEFFKEGLQFLLWSGLFEDDHSQQRLRDADLLKFGVRSFAIIKSAWF